ncbi:MAG: SDR family NAD(P)-dependent oxidoreductase [Blastocatellia bacterium]|nr:SDR family NAD(P)-dependent oxidoreductase [Blastocatellia bacterium]
MKEFKDKVAVVTGGASGIGRAIVEKCLKEEMKVVIADVEEKVLRKTEQELKAEGGKLLAVVTDVSKASDIEALADKTLEAFGSADLLCNNAGVGGGTTIWESSLSDWEWVMGVNLWGVIYGVRTFVPIMLEQGREAHIVNTASMAGLINHANTGIYNLTKHAVVSLSETLHHELAERNSKVKVSVLCPGLVKTQILDSARNRPANIENPLQMSAEEQKRYQAWSQALQNSMPPEKIADAVMQAVREEKFYILTHQKMKPMIEARMQEILQERNPTDPLAGTGM